LNDNFKSIKWELFENKTSWYTTLLIFIPKFSKHNPPWPLCIEGNKPPSIQTNTIFEWQLQINQVRSFWKHNTMIHNYLNFHYKILHTQHTMAPQTFGPYKPTTRKKMNSVLFILNLFFHSSHHILAKWLTYHPLVIIFYHTTKFTFLIRR